MATTKPKLIVFDLDYTLWPFWIDTHHDPPFKKLSDGTIRDRRNKKVKCYPDVPGMLAKLHQEGYKIGIASRTSCIQEAQDLVKLFGWDQNIHYSQIFPDCKLTHFKKLHAQSGIEYKQMIFFDDEYRNIRDVSSIGVTCIHAEEGMSNGVLNQGLSQFASTHSSS